MADRVGQQLGNYRLTRLLGRGGFAEVYLAEHVRLRTQAAIKVLYTQLEEDDVEEFLTEARTIAHLIHPHIVRIFDFDVHDGLPFLVMDYATNGTLRHRHPKGTSLPLPTIVDYIRQITDALQYAHDEKLIHRDIKPENMLVGRRNEILLSDFGIALVAQSSQLQNTQEVVGTAYYMAPEQLQGKPRLASDQYSLGVVVYEWLGGSQPFRGSFSEIASQHMFVPPPPLHEKIPTISPDVEQVVMTALAKDPHKRFGSVKAFANALEQAMQSSRPYMSSSLSRQPLAQINPITPVLPLMQSDIAPPPSLPSAAVASPNQPVSEFSTATPPYQTPVQFGMPNKPELPKQSISRRTILGGLAGIIGLVGAGGGIIWLVYAHSSSRFTTTSRLKSTPTSLVSAKATASPKAATTNNLPTPASFQTIHNTAMGISIKYPTGWVVTGPKQASTDDMFVDFVPPQQLGIELVVKRISGSTAAGFRSTTDANKANLTEFNAIPQVHNLQPTSASQPTIGGVKWDEQDASFNLDNGDAYHFVTIAVQHNKFYYTISFFTPQAVYNEAMQKYIQPMLDSFHFLS